MQAHHYFSLKRYLNSLSSHYTQIYMHAIQRNQQQTNQKKLRGIQGAKIQSFSIRARFQLLVKMSSTLD